MKRSDTQYFERFNGFAALYDKARPAIPDIIPPLLIQYIKKKKIDTLVDIGCGTGLSTTAWLPYAETIIGIEPNYYMRRKFLSKIGRSTKIKVIDADSYNTTLNTECADAVIFSQAFHWMKPHKTLRECNRILKQKGAAAVIYHDWPVLVNYSTDIAYECFYQSVKEMLNKYSGKHKNEGGWPINKHKYVLMESGYFSHVREILLHSCEKISADRFTDMALSKSPVQLLIKKQLPDINTFVKELKSRVRNSFKNAEGLKMYIGYHLIIGLKN